MSIDEKFMQRCIQLAKNGQQNAKPNPMVGAVIVHNGRIIGEGYHERCGKAHAEVNAFASVKNEDETFSVEKTIYEKNELETVVVPVKRKDINGNILRCKCLFPYDERYPFIKSRFTGGSTENARHPNGAIGIDKIDYYVTQKEADFINELGGCSQLSIHIGEQPMKVHFLYEK